MTPTAIPYCPKCGKKDNVTILSNYLKAWRCDSCEIKFNFSKCYLSENQSSNPINDYKQEILNSSSNTTDQAILDPAGIIFFERILNKIHLTTDMDSLQLFLNSEELRSELSTLNKEGKSNIGHINLDKGVIECSEF